jgi:hypothetical protein
MNRAILAAAAVALAGCGAEVQPVECPGWEDLRAWRLTGTPHTLEHDRCGATTARLRGPGEIQARRDAGGTLGAQVIADCAGYVLFLGDVPFRGRVGELYTSATLPSPASVQLTVPASCWASLRLDFKQ